MCSLTLASLSAVSCISFSLSARRSSYTFTPAMSLISSKRFSSFIVVSLFTLFCGTMLYGLFLERPEVSSSCATSVLVTCFELMKYSSFFSPIERRMVTWSRSTGMRPSLLSMTTSTCAESTWAPVPSCSIFLRSSARSGAP